MADKTVTVKPSGGTYTTLAGAIAGELTANADITAAGMDGILYIEIGGTWASVDSASALLNGFTTDATHYVKIYTDTANRARASSWNTGKYILAVSNLNVLDIRDQYVWVDGLQVQTPAINSNEDQGIAILGVAAGGSLIQVSNCRVRGAGAAETTYYQYLLVADDTDATVRFWNCIVENSSGHASSRGISFNVATGDAYNCVVYGCPIGFRRSAGTVGVYDSVSFNNGDDFSGTFNAIDYCASDDGDGTNDVAEGTTGGAAWPNIFEDAANGDFRLKAGVALIGAGGMAGSSIFSDDMDGTTRGAAWDVGAYEYVASGSTPIVKIINE